MERTQRRARPALLAALVLAAPVTIAALPAQAAPQTYDYDALGDSYAAGLGLEPGQAHPYLLDGRMRIALDDAAAVPGATVTSLAAQLPALDAETDLVTLSVGGNDIPWVNVVVACGVGTDQQCAFLLAQAGGGIAQLPAALGQAYTAVRTAAPGAHVVVTGYPRLFSPEYGDYSGTVVLPGLGPVPFHVSVAEQQAMNALADQLNGTVAGVAAGHGFQFVDVTGRFVGHGVNAPDAWIGDADDPELLHPSVEGQDAYAAALTSQINPRSLR